MIPLFVDCSGKRVVIFGGGEVASRKAAYFSGEADVLVVSRSFSHKMSLLPVKRQMLETDRASDDVLNGIIDGAFVVIGALSDSVQNNRIKNLCRAREILFNKADGEAGARAGRTLDRPSAGSGTGGGSRPVVGFDCPDSPRCLSHCGPLAHAELGKEES
jgi:hypothetical protein